MVNLEIMKPTHHGEIIETTKIQMRKMSVVFFIRPEFNYTQNESFRFFEFQI